VAVSQVVQGWVGSAQVGGGGGAFECFAADFAFEAVAVSTREQQRLRLEEGPALFGVREQASGERVGDVDRASRLAFLVVCGCRRVRAGFDADDRMLAVEVADRQAERFPDSQPGEEQEFE
jgi:hypothetical protein